MSVPWRHDDERAVRSSSLRRRGRRSRADSAIATVLLACASVSILTTLAVITVLAVETFGFFREVSLVEFLTNPQ